jgi:perosamine synthetase
MRRIAFTCNSLTMKHYLLFLLHLVWPWGRNGNALFANAVAGFFGIPAERIFLFGAARMGLYSLLKSLQLSSDDEVIVAGYTCVVVPNAVKYVGLKIRYVDISEETLNINTSLLLAAINDHTKVIVITHNFGIVYEDISMLKEKFPDLVIIEDAAHTFGSTGNSGKKAGLLGDASFFSLEFSKAMTTGMGGVLLINRPDLLEKMKTSFQSLGHYPFGTRFKIFATLKTHFLTSYPSTIFLNRYVLFVLRKLSLLYSSPAAELKGELPENYPVKLSSSFAYLGYLQVKDMVSMNEKKYYIATKYHDAIKNIEGIHSYNTANVVFGRYPLLLKNEITEVSYHELRRTITKHSGIETGEWFNDVVHPRGSYRYMYTDHSCPVGESVAKRILNLPVTVRSVPNDIQVRRIADILAGYALKKEGSR